MIDPPNLNSFELPELHNSNVRLDDLPDNCLNDRRHLCQLQLLPLPIDVLTDICPDDRLDDRYA
ncbi:hypothetical protein CsSME_00037837 [Camellia sinensis var. sinensis]